MASASDMRAASRPDLTPVLRSSGNFIRQSTLLADEDRPTVLNWQQLQVLPLPDSVDEIVASIDWRLGHPLEPMQFEAAVAQIRTFAHVVGMQDVDGYLEDVRKRGAIIADSSVDGWLSRKMQGGESGGSPEGRLRLLSRLMRESRGRQPVWTGWSASGLAAVVYETHSESELERRVQQVTRPLHSGHSRMRPLASPSASLQDRLRRHQPTLILDLVFYARHAAKAELTAPWMLRMWWDEDRHVWHPQLLVCAVQMAVVTEPFVF